MILINLFSKSDLLIIFQRYLFPSKHHVICQTARRSTYNINLVASNQPPNTSTCKPFSNSGVQFNVSPTSSSNVSSPTVTSSTLFVEEPPLHDARKQVIDKKTINFLFHFHFHYIYRHFSSCTTELSAIPTGVMSW